MVRLYLTDFVVPLHRGAATEAVSEAFKAGRMLELIIMVRRNRK